ncbi:MAG: hypothetical protein WDO73_26100 [Ignavibacteriota bacterium]
MLSATFRRSPGLISAAVLATALGVGANTAIFSVIQAVLLRPLPYRDSARLVMIWDKNPISKAFWQKDCRLPGAITRNGNHRTHSFSGMAAMQQLRVQVTGSGRPEDLEAVRITPDFSPRCWGERHCWDARFCPTSRSRGKIRWPW